MAASYLVSGAGPTLLARNGGGDPYFTDGEIEISRLRPGCESYSEAPAVAQGSPAVEAKKSIFRLVAPAWRWLMARL